jgi:hypothetical protein
METVKSSVAPPSVLLYLGGAIVIILAVTRLLGLH